MMNNVSHRGRWMYNPLGQYQPRTWWEKLLRWLDDLFDPLLLPEGRRRIDPAQPYGHWANGWSRPTLPHTEGGHRPTNEANACAWPKCSQHAALRRGMADTKERGR